VLLLQDEAVDMTLMTSDIASPSASFPWQHVIAQFGSRGSDCAPIRSAL